MRKRLVMTGTIVAVSAALAVSGVLSASAAMKPTAPAQPAAPAPVAAAAPLVRAPAPSTDRGPEKAAWGTVIGTGIRDSAGELVFYGVHVSEPRLPRTHFGIMAGLRDAAGRLTGLNLANEFQGADTAAGFHAVSGGIGVNGHDVPAFGYYSGPAAKITAKIGGKTVQAHQAQWSVDPRIVVFWFEPGPGDPANLAAFDAAGKQLPAGHTGVGHG